MSSLNNIFINPNGSNKDVAFKIFENAVKLLLDFLSSANKLPVLPSEDKFLNLKFELPEKHLNESDLQEELSSIISLSMNPANSNYIGHMDSLPSIYSIIGSLYSAALNNNMFSLEMSPYFTRLEYALIKQFSSLFGLPETASGLIASGGTLSNIQAIITARNYFLKSNGGDISKSKGKLVLFASEHAHISIRKAVMIAGMGIDSLIPVSADIKGKMNVHDLISKIEKAIKSGQHPIAVIATIGTTITGNIDPINEIAEVCKKHKIWFHADAIYGGALILSNNTKYRLKGIEQADSISFNPQKWMHVSKTCSLLMFREEIILHTYFSMKAFYTKEQNDFVNLSELGIQGTKHAEVLKLWLSILSIGLSGFEKMIDHSMAVTQYFIQQLNQIPDVEFATATEMNIPTFRLKSKFTSNEDELNKAFNDYAIREHNIFFSLPRYNGKLWQRTILMNPFIDNTTIQRVVNCINRFFQSGI